MNDPEMNVSEQNYSTWLNDCLGHLKNVNTLASEQFGIGGYECWGMSQETGLLTFSNKGQIEVIADAVIVGSFSFVSQTWLWGWANGSILPNLTQDLLEIKRYGQENGLLDLVEPKWEGEEQDAWTMAAIALQLIGGQAVYRGPSESGLTFILLRNLRWA